mmetsp:Transcript_9310/g.20700  ORF Transcript_9310/g.20700 Transcript_9310/m.20700 type:complete len:202 (+) Transcript_9310:187-792(+)
MLLYSSFTQPTTPNTKQFLLHQRFALQSLSSLGRRCVRLYWIITCSRARLIQPFLWYFNPFLFRSSYSGGLDCFFVGCVTCGCLLDCFFSSSALCLLSISITRLSSYRTLVIHSSIIGNHFVAFFATSLQLCKKGNQLIHERFFRLAPLGLCSGIGFSPFITCSSTRRRTRLLLFFTLQHGVQLVSNPSPPFILFNLTTHR